MRKPTKSSLSFPSPLGPLLFLLAVVLFQAAFFRPFFQTNDDIFKCFFVKGVGTDLTPTEFIGYSNPLLGHLLKTLYQILPTFPWYGFLMLGVQTLSLGALLRAAWPTSRGLFTGSLFLIAYLAFYLNLFTSPQFTMTASLAAQGSLFLSYVLARRERSGPHWAGWTLVGFLAVASVLIRMDASLLTVFCALPFLVGNFHKGLSFPRAFLLGAGLLCATCALFEVHWYRADPAWKDFQRFDKERVEMQDYRLHRFDEGTKPFFEKVGWTQNDYEMFKDWYFMDQDRYATGRLQELKRHFPRIGAQGKPSSYGSFSSMMTDHWVLASFALTLAFLLLSPPGARPLLLLQAGWVVGALALMLYLLRAPDRVVWPLVALPLGAALITAVPPPAGSLRSLILGPSRKGSRNWGFLVPWAGVLLSLWVLVGAGRFFLPYHRFNEFLVMKEGRLKEDVARLAPKQDQLFVVWDSSFPFEGYDGLDDLEGFRGFHLFSLAVYQRAPNAARMLERFHLKDLFLDLVDRPDVFLICTPQEGAMYHRYMMEKHGRKVYPERYYAGNYFNTFRIHSHPPPRP